MMELLNPEKSPMKVMREDEAEYAVLGEERCDRGDVEESPMLDPGHKFYWEPRRIPMRENGSGGGLVKCCCFYSFCGVIYLSSIAALLRKEYFYTQIPGGEVPYSTQKLAEPVGGKSATIFSSSFIGVDYGEKRVGLAVTIGVAPRPSIRLENVGNHTLLAQNIIKVAARERASRIIVGFPLEKNGTEGVMSDTVRLFSQTLADEWHVSAWGCKFNNVVGSGVVLWDERYSSWEAKTRLKDNYDISSGNIDVMSAICILEHYLEEGGKGSEVVKPSQKISELRHNKTKSKIAKDKGNGV